MRILDLYPHNQRAYDALAAKLAAGEKTCIVQPTGTGKSYIASEYLAQNPGKRAVYLAPSIFIHDQIRRTATEQILSNTSFLTYSALHHMEKHAIEQLESDIIILDEFHRAGAENWNKEVSLLLDSHPDADTFGITATPIRFLDKKGPTDMVEELFSGNVAHTYTYAEAIADGVLVEPKYIVSDIYIREKVKAKLDSLVSLGTRYTGLRKKYEPEFRRILDVIETANGIETLFQIHLETSAPKLIVFCRGVQGVEEAKEYMAKWLSWSNAAFHEYVCHYEHADSDSNIYDFIQDTDVSAIRLLYAIDMVSEGIHIDDLDGVVMLRPTISPILYLQQAGRAMSVKPTRNKKPVIFDLVNNYHYAVIPAPKEDPSDERCVMRDYTPPSGSAQEYLALSSIIVLPEIKQFLSICARFDYERKNFDWNIWLELVVEYKTIYGELPQKKTEYKGYKIGFWLVAQKNMFNKGILKEARMHQLQEKGIIDETWISWLDAWEKKVMLVKEYFNKHGKLPKRRTVYKGVNIGAWLSVQKRHYRHGGNSKLDKDKNKVLENLLGLDPEYMIMKTTWENTFDVFVDFVDKNGRFPKQGEVWEGKNIGAWFFTYKREYNLGKMSKDRVELFKEHGFITNNGVNEDLLAVNAQWLENLNTLVEFYNEMGRLPYAREKFNGHCIGNWFGEQKRLFRTGEMSKYKREKLLNSGILTEFDFIPKKDI